MNGWLLLLRGAMRLSVIDIGTNTVLLLVADIDQQGSITPVFHGHDIVRLGAGVDEQRRILPDALQRAEQTIGRFVNDAKSHKSERIIACGTSALRDAENRAEFVARIKDSTGVDIEILSGDEEAELTYLGAMGEFAQPGHNQKFVVLDIGGGSTEITAGTETVIQSKQSYDMGCVRLTERFLKTSPPSSLGISQALQSMRKHLSPLNPLDVDARLIGVAGTLTTLGALDLNLPGYDPLKVSGHRLKRETVESIFNMLRIKTKEEIEKIPQILQGRADILLAGILILIEVMKQLEAEEIIVSDRGLRYGVARRALLR